MRLYLFDIFAPVFMSGMILIYMVCIYYQLKDIFIVLRGIQLTLSIRDKNTVVDVPSFMKRNIHNCKEILRKEKNEF